MRHLRSILTLLCSSALLIACGDDSPADDGAPAPRADGGASNAQPDAGGKPSSSGAVVYSGAPTCDEAGLELQGTLDGNTLDESRPISGAVRLDTSLRTLERNYDESDYDGSDEILNISWGSALTKGQVATIEGGSLYLPMKDFSPYCVQAGKVGFDPKQPSEGDRIQFLITSVRKMEGESCTGPALPANLKGCLTLFGVKQN